MEKAPGMDTGKDQRILGWSLVLLSVVSALGVYVFSTHIQAEGWLEVSANLRVARAGAWVGIGGLAALTGFVWLGGAEQVAGWLEVLLQRLARLRWVLVLVMPVLLVGFPVLMFGRFQAYFSQDWTRHAIFAWLVVLLAACIVAFWHKSWLEAVLFSGFSLAVVYHLATYLPHVTNYPFSLWWSETTRFYMASTFFDQRIYNQDLPWVFRDLTRYLIQAVPFSIPGAPLWVHRLWQALLRFTTPYLTGWVLARRLNLSSPKVLGLFTAWTGLYFFQGPVFYNLIVIVMLVFWLVDSRRFWKTTLAVIVVSIYAGFSRINWVPMAGLMAAAFYFLEIPVPSGGWRNVLRYLSSPVIWVLAGTAIGFGAQQFWVANSGNPEEILYSSFTSYLIWERLFPNPSYPLGILPHILLVTGPLLVFLGIVFRTHARQVHPIRWLALAGMTGVLFGGGLLVSVKIGGGTNLHNMDVYLVLLLIIAVEIYFGRMVAQDRQKIHPRMPVWLKAAILVMPVLFVTTFVGRTVRPLDSQVARQDLARLQKYVDQAVKEEGQVLFVSQRHLITFGLIKNVPLVHEHEKLLLQEMVMSRNEVYLESFGHEMAEQRYALIVTDHLPSAWKNPDKVSLALENNVVLNELVPRITCAYEEHDRLLGGGLDILTPREVPTCVQDKE